MILVSKETRKELYSSLGNGAGYQEDYVVAGFGDDIIYANGGDIVHAGAGNDVIFFDYTGKEAEIHGGSGFDVVQVNGSINDYYFVANHGSERPGIYTEGNSNNELRLYHSVEKLVFEDAEFLIAPQVTGAQVTSPTTIEVFFDRLIADANYLDAQDFELYVGGNRVYYSSAEIIPANSDPVTVGDKVALHRPQHEGILDASTFDVHVRSGVLKTARFKTVSAVILPKHLFQISKISTQSFHLMMAKFP